MVMCATVVPGVVPCHSFSPGQNQTTSPGSLSGYIGLAVLKIFTKRSRISEWPGEAKRKMVFVNTLQLV
jgi:hypothetical protein